MTPIKNKVGFSLIEIMIVVAILSLLASIFVPRSLKKKVKARQNVCLNNLTSLFEAEKTFFSKNKRWGTSIEELDWKPVGPPTHEYHFIPLLPPETGFLFECIGNIDDDPALDRALIDKTGQISQISDDLKILE